MPLSGHSHSFDTGIAKELGLHCAIIYNHIIYWLKVNAAKGQGIVNGKVWMYESQQQIADFLEYISLDEVKKSIPKLVEAGYLIKDNHNKNPFDKTSWYTVENQDIIQKSFTKVPNGTIDRVNFTIDSANRHLPECESAPCIYDNKNKEIITNDDDRVREAKEEFFLTIDSKGREKQNSIPEFIRYLRGCKYSDETIKEAIKRTQTFPDPISNALRFVDSICRQIDAQNAKEKENFTPRPIIKEKTVTWEEFQRNKNKGK
jgi:hypothetical protein